MPIWKIYAISILPNRIYFRLFRFYECPKILRYFAESEFLKICDKSTNNSQNAVPDLYYCIDGHRNSNPAQSSALSAECL